MSAGYWYYANRRNVLAGMQLFTEHPAIVATMAVAHVEATTQNSEPHGTVHSALRPSHFLQLGLKDARSSNSARTVTLNELRRRISIDWSRNLRHFVSLDFDTRYGEPNLLDALNCGCKSPVQVRGLPIELESRNSIARQNTRVITTGFIESVGILVGYFRMRQN
jgi:hypothetical protein